MKAHSGVLHSAIQVVDAVKPELERMMELNPKRKVILVGHSLGAATALLATLDFFGEDSDHYDYMLAGKVECWAFGPPPVLSHPEKLPDCIKSSIFTFVHNFDIVPRLCPVAICKLLLAVDYVHRQGFWRFRRWYGKVGSANHLPDFMELEEEHRSAWRTEWDRKDIEVVGSRKAMRCQRAVRLFRFHQVSAGDSVGSGKKDARVPDLVNRLFRVIHADLCEVETSERPSSVVTSTSTVGLPRLS